MLIRIITTLGIHTYVICVIHTMNEEDFIKYLEDNNSRFFFVIEDRKLLPSLKELNNEIARTEQSLDSAKLCYWQVLKDFASLQILLILVSSYQAAKIKKIELTKEILDSMKPDSLLVDLVFARNLKRYTQTV